MFVDGKVYLTLVGAGCEVRFGDQFQAQGGVVTVEIPSAIWEQIRRHPAPEDLNRSGPDDDEDSSFGVELKP